MGRRGWAAAVAIALALGLASPAEAAKRTIRGLVTAHATGQPLAGIEVCARSEAGRGHTACATSDATGRYRITVPQARYRVEASDPYLYGDWVTRRWPGGTVVADRERVVNFAMRAGARVRVQLTSATGPISPYMSLRAYAVRSGGKLAAVDPFSNLTVAADGTSAYAEVAKLAAGTYAFRLTWNQVEDSRHAEAWYPATGSAGQARRITVAEGDDRWLEDMPLQRPAQLKVTVQRPDGGRTDAEVRVHDASGRLVAAHAERGSKPGNVTTLRGLPAGRYRIKVVETTHATSYVEWHPTGTRFSQARDVVLRAGTTEKVTTKLAYRTPRTTSRPRTVHEGFVITATHLGTFSPAPTRRRLLWYRDGRLTDWVGRNYGVERSDIGHRITACLMAYRPGWGHGRACSTPYVPRVVHRDPS